MQRRDALKKLRRFVSVRVAKYIHYVHLLITKSAGSLLIRLACILIAHDCRLRSVDLSSRLCLAPYRFQNSRSCISAAPVS
jgi:hypothetical protein